MSVVLVTGGRGMVGKSIQQVLRDDVGLKQDPADEWVFAGSSDGDLTDLGQTKALFHRVKPTHVVHLAARVGGLFANMDANLEFFQDNMTINDNVLRVAHECRVKKVVSCLSTCIFPDKTTYPIDETMVHNGPPHFSNEGYSYAKRTLDILTRLYNQKYDTNWCCVIPTNIYGPHDNYGASSHVIPGLMHKVYRAKQANEPNITVLGSGKPLRQFTYSLDIARLMVWAIYRYDGCDPIIFSVPESDEISIDEAAKAIVDAMEFKGEIVHDTTKSDGQFKKTACNARLMGLYPEFRFTPFREAIKASVNWFVNNYDTARKF